MRWNLVWALALVLAALPAVAQAPGNAPMDPPYLSDMPSVERVKAEIQGSDPTDTLARQVAVFTYLSAYIDRIKYNRTYSGPYTPDEQRLRGAYSLAGYQISQAYAKSHTPAEATAFERLHGQYEMNSAFYADWSKRLIGKQSAAAYHGAEAGLAATAKAHYDEQKRVNEEANRAPAQGKAELLRPTNDPGTLAARRCLELGGSDLECVGKGFMKGLGDMFGMGADPLQLHTRSGLVMAGRYTGQPVSVSFGDDAVTIEGCGKLVPGSHKYNVIKKGDHLLIEAANQPRPLVLDWTPNGRIAGPGLVDVQGQVITGYRKYWVESRRTSDNSIVAGSGHEESVPIYADKIERCAIGALTPQPVPAGSAAPVGGMVGEMLGAVVDKFVSHQIGPRIVGKFASSGGLAVEFNDDSAVLDCGEAHVRRDYSIQNTASQFLVTVQNGSTPFSLALQPGGALAAPGSTEIAGRILTGMNGDQTMFSPRNARCALGTLAAGASAGPVSAMSPLSAASASGDVPIANSGVSANSSAGAGAAVLSLTTGLPAQPGRPSPLNGLTMYLLKESFAGLVTKSGIRPAAGMSPIQAWGAACDKHAPECPQAMNAVRSSVATQVKLDMEGKASFPAQAPATYHLFGWVFINQHHLVWDVPIELKPGANAFVIDQRSAVAVN